MKPYLNLNGKSGVVSYETTDDSIHVIFKSGSHRNYLYNHASPGKVMVDKMKALAAQGHGLNSYISTTVQTSFAKKW